ncbi:MAG: low molecular weight phosphotyrosine protein phosphatase [Muribaculaceae bacterium]|nr:low molecular weight phosphotyrosine protein phosphatase [Muribaculaceae bacterium]
MKTKILFICLGNICRSPAAEGVMQRLVEEHGLGDCFEIDSAGTYSGHHGQLPDPRMRRHASRRGYNLTHRARPIESDDFDYFDIIVAMDEGNRRNLMQLASSPQQQAKIVMMGDYIVKLRAHYDYVPDPYYEGAEGFELALDLLEDACGNLLNDIINNKL